MSIATNEQLTYVTPLQRERMHLLGFRVEPCPYLTWAYRWIHTSGRFDDGAIAEDENGAWLLALEVAREVFLGFALVEAA